MRKFEKKINELNLVKGKLSKALNSNIKDFEMLEQSLVGLHAELRGAEAIENNEEEVEKLGVHEVHLGSSNKREVYLELKSKWHFHDDDVCYMGDDIPDIPLLKIVGLAVCPADAAPEVKEVSHYISNKNGGHGCVRDLMEQALKLHGHWMNEESVIW